MMKKVFMAIALIALIGTSAVFAQQPTLDKLTFTPSPRNNPTAYIASAANNQISGAVVIPGAYEGVTLDSGSAPTSPASSSPMA